MRRFTLAILAVIGGAAIAIASEPVGLGLPAKMLFGRVPDPSAGPPRPIGSYAKGCLAGATPLPVDGPNWQVMRLSRNRHWGMPALVSYIEKLSADAEKVGWNGLLVGDMSQPRGGPMASGHASHQVGLDVDIWFTPMPDRVLSAEEREKIGATNLLIGGKLEVDPAKWNPAAARLLRAAASYPEVERIFVSAAIKKRLCDSAGTDSAWLRKLRPWAGHADHFHVRLVCPPGLAGCVSQAPPPPGDGCGAELAKWFEPPPKPKPGTKPPKPRPPPRDLTLADLPPACSAVLNDGLEPGTAQARVVPLPRPRPATN